MLERNKSSRSRPKLIRRPKRKPAGPIRGGLFAGYATHSDGFVIEDDDADDPIIVWGGTRHDSGNDASGAGEDAIANDGDDQAGAGDVTQHSRSTSMLTRKKSIRSRTRHPSRKRSKFITPDLVLHAGKLMRHVASPDNPLSKAEHLRGAYAEVEDGHDAKVRQFLERAYFVAAQFRRQPGDFERLQAHSFWKETRQKPKDPSTSKWVLYFITQARTPNVRNRAGKYAVILDGLMHDQVEISAVAARIKELGGIDAAYEAIASKPSPNCGHQAQGGPLGKSASSRPASTSGKTSSTVSSAVDLASGGNPKGGRLIKGGKWLKQVARRSPPERPPLNRRALNSRAKLAAALAQTRAELRSGPSADMRLQLQQEEDFLLEWREEYEENILDRKRALREKKKAARLQRMGGPLRR